MRAIVLMFDTLNRRFLPPYGARDVHAPNFQRLAERTATFDTCYGGSMPCIPARREMHTGRHNFLHRSWGPLEPFDDSVPQLLAEAGVHTHLATDHQHYWEDGGATYHNRFSTYEFFRGQEGDRWKGQVAPPAAPATVNWRGGPIVRQDWVNRGHYPSAAQHPQTLTVDAGLEFLATNADADRWMLQLECFDPHEPFVSYPEHRQHYLHDYDGDHFDWPDYRRVAESPEEVAHVRAEYSALLTMCDASLGRVLDAMDEHSLWEDTLLVVCTDHGLLLGERGWWGKNVQPWYEENIHTPLFVWDPRSRAAGQRRSALVQTVDLAPTLLRFFDVEVPPDVEGRDLAPAIATDAQVRELALFGSFGGHVNVTDGRYVYLRACADASNSPLEEFTLMPTHMNQRYSPDELRDAVLAPPLPFTKGIPVLRLPAAPWGNPWAFGTLLFDLTTDPAQQNPLVEDELELRMATALRDAMLANAAPDSQFHRLGLPVNGPLGPEHLLCRVQSAQVARSLVPVPAATDFVGAGPSVTDTVSALLATPATREVLLEHLPVLRTGTVAATLGDRSPWQLTVQTPGLTTDALLSLQSALRATVGGAE